MSLALVDALPLISVHVTLTVLLWMPKDVYHASVKVPKIQIHQAPVIQENTSSTTLCFFFSHNGCSKWSVNVCNSDVGSGRWRVSFFRFQHLWPQLCGNGRTGLYVMSLQRYFYNRPNVVTCIRFAIYRSELNCIFVSDVQPPLLRLLADKPLQLVPWPVFPELEDALPLILVHVILTVSSWIVKAACPVTALVRCYISCFKVF